MLGQASPPNEVSFALRVEDDEPALSQDVASQRSSRFLWLALGCAVIALMALSTCSSLPLSSHASVNPSRDAQVVAFIPSLPALGLAGLRSAITSRSSGQDPSSGPRMSARTSGRGRLAKRPLPAGKLSGDKMGRSGRGHLLSGTSDRSDLRTPTAHSRNPSLRAQGAFAGGLQSRQAFQSSIVGLQSQEHLQSQTLHTDTNMSLVFGPAWTISTAAAFAVLFGNPHAAQALLAGFGTAFGAPPPVDHHWWDITNIGGAPLKPHHWWAITNAARGPETALKLDPFAAYMQLLGAYPLPTKALTGSVLCVTGDAMAQFSQKKATLEAEVDGMERTQLGSFRVVKPDLSFLDTTRSLGFALFGSAYHGVWQHNFFPWLEANCKGDLFAAVMSGTSIEIDPHLLAAAERTCVNQFVCTPLIYYPTYFAITGAVLGLDPQAALQRAKELFIPLISRNLAFWIPVNFAIFATVPVEQQVPAVCSAALVWNVILSSVSEQKATPELKPAN